MRLERRAKSEAGFTLIELLIVVVVMGGIVAAISQGVVFGLRSTVDTTDKIADSSDTLVSAALFGTDAASGISATTGVGCLAVPGTILGFTWTAPPTPPATTDTTNVSSYVLSGATLTRNLCPNGASSPTASVVVARSVSSTPQPIVGSSPTCGTDTVSRWVSLKIITKSGYVICLSGQRRTTT